MPLQPMHGNRLMTALPIVLPLLVVVALVVARLWN